MKNRNNYEVQKKRAKYRKMMLIEKAGGECKKCGYSKNIAALDFHHTKDKKFRLDSRHLSNSSWDRILREFEKCILLCANCHREHHNPNFTKDKVKLELDETYNPKKSTENRCSECGTIISSKAKMCVPCFRKSREKIKWPETSWLEEKALEYSFSALSRRLGVSGNAIRKRIKNHK
jgi:ribosomal protein S14